MPLAPPSVADFLGEFDYGIKVLKWRYEADSHRCHPFDPPYTTDCSGSGCAILAHLGEDIGCLGSFAMSRRAHQLGLGISIEEARRTPGAMLFIGPNEGQGALDGSLDGAPGVPGHVGYSVGNGTHTVEARGHSAGVGYFIWNSLRWDWASKPFPEITTTAYQPPADMPLANAQTEQDDAAMILMPNTKWTPPNELGRARIIRPFNFVLLESGAKVIGSHDINGNPATAFWAPPKKDEIPGWQIEGCFTVPRDQCKQHGMKEEPWGYLTLVYSVPDGSTRTYSTPIVVG